MIARAAKIRELTRRTLAGGDESFAVSLSFDESTETVLRLSREEHDDLALAMRSGARFTVSLRVAAPSLSQLAEGEQLSTMTTSGGST